MPVAPHRGVPLGPVALRLGSEPDALQRPVQPGLVEATGCSTQPSAAGDGLNSRSDM